ncbi:hypothetical protein [Cupriavidus sp. UYPR2.512]|uniref:aspartate racemase/maleate isomerase family protein n=1 Tax=Cupriavidus sp. UYPR2.512 TaxID=1080187 RepID=UPI001E64597F|nr:hypothetical protein [Cupriavidus sp. UYPR2.512]
MLISCADIQVGAVVAEIERMGRPVITSNQALLWHCLKTLALPDRPPGYGALLRREFE